MRRLWLLLAALALLAGCGYGGVPAAEAPPVNGHSIPVAAPADVAAAPASVSIPKLGITDEVVPVGLCAKVAAPKCTSVNGLEVPDVHKVGYYTGLPNPGAPGSPALLAGHVNYAGTVGSLARIGELRSGDRLTVTDEAGTVRTFEVYAVVEFPKTEYPQRKVDLFAAVPAGSPAEVRLFTCSGQIVGHSYLNNTVVSAHEVSA